MLYQFQNIIISKLSDVLFIHVQSWLFLVNFVLFRVLNRASLYTHTQKKTSELQGFEVDVFYLLVNNANKKSHFLGGLLDIST